MTTQEKLIKDERQIRYFGFTTDEFTSEARDYIRKQVEDALDGQLRGVLAAKTTNKQCIDEKTDEIRCVCLKHIDNCINKLTSVSRELFDISSNVVLPGEIGERNRVSDDQLSELKRQVEELEEKFCEEKYYMDLLEDLSEKYEKAAKIRQMASRYVQLVGDKIETVDELEIDSESKKPFKKHVEMFQ